MNCVYARLCTHLWCVCACVYVVAQWGRETKKSNPKYAYIYTYVSIYIYTYMVEVIIATVGREYVT